MTRRGRGPARPQSDVVAEDAAWHPGAMTRELHITGDEAADRLRSDDDFALLTGMLLDQQVR
ncbi:hypothetical protein SAMN04487783_1362 [Agrococcus baldri]|uniref:Uncharacterized protein n=1 Tax=Agrococcus baldri TaxID=153730 RepID=A0AA94HMA4_9MICO|nr:hypothetical protein SAMN04487783_1362 [Agrococcus baldri]